MRQILFGFISKNCYGNMYSLPQTNDFQPFSSHGTHKLITKILQHTQKYVYFADLAEK